MRIHAEEVKLLHRELDELKQWMAKQPGISGEQKEAP
jgi:hypothetical protein